MKPAGDVLAVARRVLAPPPRLRLSEWLEAELELPQGVSALPGRVRLWPFQREIADAIGDPAIERVTLVKPVRVGFTTLLTGAIASYVANDPAPILCLLPTEADCRDYVVSDVEPVFRATAAVRGALADDAEEGERNTLMSRRFPGGSLKIVAAKAPRNLRRHNVRVLLIDEADAMETTPEGSPILLAERRTLSFPDRKIVVGSTPVHEDTSHVLRLYAQSDRRVFEVPCPECGHWHEIGWADIRWEEGRPETAHYVCPACGACVEERHKVGMVTAGRWRATAPQVQGHAGFRLNALVALHANASWAKLAREWLEAKDDATTRQTFVNTILAQGWAGAGEELDETDLAGRAEPFGLGAIPEEVLIITAGCDVQHDRIETTLIGWCEAGRAWVLGHATVWGRVADDDAVWADFDDVLQTTWAHPLGGRIGVDAAAVDAGDGQTMDRVVAFCRSRRKVFAVKGDGGNRPAIERSRSAKFPLWIVGVDTLKAQLMTRLAMPGAVRFSADLPPVWYEQLASERVVTRYQRGQPVRRFERIPGRRAEALDCVIYATAVRQLVAMNPAARRAALSGNAAPPPVRSEPRRPWIAKRKDWL